METDYKKKYEEAKKELDLLRKRLGARKENLVNSLHNKLGLKEDIEKDRFLTYGYFLWKLNIEELLYLDEVLARPKSI